PSVPRKSAGWDTGPSLPAGHETTTEPVAPAEPLREADALLPAEHDQRREEAGDTPRHDDADRNHDRGEAGALVHDRAQRIVHRGERQRLYEPLHGGGEAV